MGMARRIADNLIERRASYPQSSLDNPELWLLNALGAITTASGVAVDEKSALTLSSYFDSVRVIIEDVSKIPLGLNERLPDGTKRKATEHPVHTLIHDVPNFEQTSYEWREYMMLRAVMRGNAYSQIVWGNSGHPIALWPLQNRWMKSVDRVGGQLVYTYLDNGERERKFGAEEIFHLRGMSLDAILGIDVLDRAKESLGAALALQEFSSRFFGSGAAIMGYLKHPKQMSDPAHKRLKQDFEEKYASLDKAHKTVILEEGTEYVKTGADPEQSQMNESKDSALGDVSRWSRVLPHKIGDLRRATFSNIEQQNIEWVQDTLMAWFVRFEQKINQKLLTPQERTRYYSKFNVDALLRGDTLSRFMAHQIAIQAGFKNPDEIREKEDMNPIPDDLGKKFFVQANWIPMEDAGKGVQSPMPPLRHIIQDIESRIARREKADITRAAKKYLDNGGSDKFNEWLQKFMVDHREFIQRQIEPLEACIGEMEGLNLNSMAYIDERIQRLDVLLEDRTALTEDDIEIRAELTDHIKTNKENNDAGMG